jgi:deoxycytidylate deaminase
MNYDKHINMLFKYAETIEEPVRCFRLAAGIVYKNSLISTGVNSYKTDPFQARFGRSEHAIHLHAEVSAIKNSLRFLNINDFKKASLIVVRVKKNSLTGKFVRAMSKPCIGCQKCIVEFGIRNVIYINDVGLFEHIQY